MRFLKSLWGGEEGKEAEKEAEGATLVLKKGDIHYTVPEVNAFELKGISSGFKPGAFAKKFKRFSFSLLYDFEKERIYLITVGARMAILHSIFNACHVKFKQLEEIPHFEVDRKTLVRYNAVYLPEEIEPTPDVKHMQPGIFYSPEEFATIWEAMKGRKAKLLVCFSAATRHEMDREKESHAKELEKIKNVVAPRAPLKHEVMDEPYFVFFLLKYVAYTIIKFFFGIVGGIRMLLRRKSPTWYTHRIHLCKMLIAMCDVARVQNDAAFNVSLFGYGEDVDALEKHLAAHFHCKKVRAEVSDELSYSLPQKGGWVMSGLLGSNFVHFPKKYVGWAERVEAEKEEGKEGQK